MFRRALISFAAITVVLNCADSVRGENQPMPQSSKVELYDADPNHLWNRLHRALFVRTGGDGTDYGFDQLDPLLWFHTKYLLEGPSHTNALTVLDEFLAVHGETLVRDPLKRAVLQRDLWAVFDWAAEWRSRKDSNSNARQELQLRLAAILPRLALTKEQINALPDNYSDAAQSHLFGNDYNSDKPTTPFFPPDLFSTNGSWVCVGINDEEPVAPVHVGQFGGRSAFLVFMRTPGGRQEATNYLRPFREFPQPYFYATSRIFTNQIEAVHSQNLPQFPVGTTFALVRQEFLVDQDGDIVPTHLTESVQIRRYNDVHPKRGAYGRSAPESQSMFEFVLSRKQLFSGIAGGLRAYAPDEKDFLQFNDNGFDPFEQTQPEHKPLSPRLYPALDCMECHSGRGIYSVSSFLQFLQTRTVTFPQVTEVAVQNQRDAAGYWKLRQVNWGLLQGLSQRR